jgi:hypothetical protein
LIFILVDGWNLVVSALSSELPLMSFGDAIGLGREAIFVTLLVAAPVLLLSMVVGLTVISFFRR